MGITFILFMHSNPATSLFRPRSNEQVEQATVMIWGDDYSLTDLCCHTSRGCRACCDQVKPVSLSNNLEVGLIILADLSLKASLLLSL